MALITSPRFGIQYPDSSRQDRPDIPLHLTNIVTSLDANGAMFGQGTFANRPVSTSGSPGKQGRFYMSTDGTGGQTGVSLLYYDLGTSWIQVTSVYAGPPADSITSVELAPNSVTSVELADSSVDSAAIIDGTIVAADLASALKPSSGAGAGTEALRSLGIGAGQALGYSDLSSSVFKSGLRASLPANSSANDGTWYFATDQEVMYFGAGGTWHRVGPQAGDVIWTFENTARSGYIICTGQAWPATNGAYADLFAKWGGLYPTTLPDLQGREFIAKGTHADVNTLGFSEGAAVANRRPKHKHTISATFTGTNANTGNESADHTHAGSGNTGTESVAHAHAFSTSFGGGATTGGGGPQGAADTAQYNGTTGGENANHTHFYSFSTGGRSAAHTHNYTPAGTIAGTVGPQTGAEPTDSAAYIVLIPQVKL